MKEMINMWPSGQKPGKKRTGKSETEKSRIEAYEHMGVGTKYKYFVYYTLIPSRMHSPWKTH